MGKAWNQVGGDVNPKEYGAILARIEPGGRPWSAGGQSGVSEAQVELVEIEPSEDQPPGKGISFFVQRATIAESDLTWDKCKDCAASSGMSRSDWQKATIVERAMTKLRHWGSDHLGGEHFYTMKWSEALPAKSNQIAWWSR